MRSVGMILLTSVVVACVEPVPEPERHSITFSVWQDEGVPLEGAKLWAGETSLGRTDASGELQTELEGPEGSRVSIRVQCPEGHRAPPEPLDVRLRSVESLTGDVPSALTMSVHCPPEERTVVLVVRAERGADLPVTVNGNEVARTDANGVAHHVFRLPPGTRLMAALDTRERSELRPRNPEAVFHVPDSDDILLFEASFSKPKPRRTPRRRAASVAPTPPRPQRIH